MRTTLMLPDDLYRQVKSAAADADRTVTSFVEEALRAALTRHADAAHPPREPYRVTAAGSGGLQPGIDLTDTVALIDAMESR
jgi:hypothetical protein